MFCYTILIIFGIVLLNINFAYSGSCSDGYVSSNGVCDECGAPDVFPNARIVGGVQALDKSYPSQVLIVQSFKGVYKLRYGYYTLSGKYYCGGTLINRFTVLTAGHCVKHQITYYDDYNYQYTLNTYPTEYYKDIESTFTVYLGITDKYFLTSGSSLPTNGISVGVKKAIRHESYNSNNYLNDLGVLILDTSVDINSYVKPACLPSTSSNYPNSSYPVFAAGWGTLHEGDSSSPRYLQNVKLAVYDSSYCSYVFPKYAKNWDSQICAGNYSGYKDTCQGDSGGGLYVYDTLGNKSHFIVSGIVSYGDGCAQYHLPGIYTRVSYYLDWIQYTIANYPNINTYLNDSQKTRISATALLCLIWFNIFIYYNSV